MSHDGHQGIVGPAVSGGDMVLGEVVGVCDCLVPTDFSHGRNPDCPWLPLALAYRGDETISSLDPERLLLLSAVYIILTPSRKRTLISTHNRLDHNSAESYTQSSDGYSAFEVPRHRDLWSQWRLPGCAYSLIR